MAAQRDTGLADDQIARLRSEVTAGRRPRVRVSGPQFPAGTIGTVLRVGDPDIDGSDFITVRVKISGVTDDLGFAPKELSPAGRGRAATPRTQTTAPATTPPKTPSRARRSGPTPVKPADEAPVRNGTRGSAPAGSRRRTPSAPVVTITITSAGSAWSVTAHRGARTVVKKAAVPPGVVAAVAALLHQPDVEDAVAAVNDTARDEAEARAEKLRAELAEVEAVLSSHRRP